MVCAQGRLTLLTCYQSSDQKYKRLDVFCLSWRSTCHRSTSLDWSHLSNGGKMCQLWRIIYINIHAILHAQQQLTVLHVQSNFRLYMYSRNLWSYMYSSNLRLYMYSSNLWSYMCSSDLWSYMCSSNLRLYMYSSNLRPYTYGSNLHSYMCSSNSTLHSVVATYRLLHHLVTIW